MDKLTTNYSLQGANPCLLSHTHNKKEYGYKKYYRMKIANKKMQIIIEGKREDGYIITLPPKQVPNDFSAEFDELHALYKILHQYFKSIKLHEK